MSNSPSLMDVGASATIIATLLGWLPPIAAALGIIWYCILIYDRFYGRKK